ncbi:MAG: ABC transporter ATP-binding protein/permease [Oscillospiraceae bacterium]|jgi:ATP-binding cassette subfamily B protein|nr:ABC transporter ATP-binding protein/permease [Oscillospiraceae bacterium]
MHDRSGSRIRALIRYTKGFRGLMALSFLLLGAELILSFISPLVLSVTFDSVLGSKPLNVPGYFRALINLLGGVEYIKERLWIMAALSVGMTVLSGLVRFGRTRLNTRAGQGSVRRLRDRLYAHIQRLPYSWHAAAQTGDIIQRATSDVDTILRFNSGVLLEFIRTVLMVFLGAFVMFTINDTLAFITIGMVIPITAVSVLFHRRINRLLMSQEEAESELFTVMQENVTGIRVVRAFGRSGFELDKFNAANEKNREMLIRANDTFTSLLAVLDLLCGLEFAAVLVTGIILVVRGGLTIGQFTVFVSYVYTFFWPIRGFGRILSQFSRTLVAAGRLEEVFLAEEESGLDEGDTPPLGGDIDFNDVSFSYGSVPVLEHLNMHIPSGSTVALLGGTGSGKSTVALLLQRLCDVGSGSVTIGGRDIRSISKLWLRSRIGIVLQEPFLYSKSILENIGIKRREPDRAEVEAAAKDACVHDDIMAFEDGYDTVVGERGVTLSGGQKQRVAIARALTGESDVYIFDDSLSAVDTRTDAAIREALRSRRRGVTTIIISHRITTLMEADRIFVLQGGKVAEEGTHEQLMAIPGGIYRRTCEIQGAAAEGGDEP